mgnify:FL=1
MLEASKNAYQQSCQQKIEIVNNQNVNISRFF